MKGLPAATLDRIHRIEAVIHRDVGRNMGPIFAAAKGGLAAATAALAVRPPRAVGVLTGFFVPDGNPPAAETDGPAGAALLARAFSRMDVACRVATDALCGAACEAALHGARVTDVPVDRLSSGQSPDALIRTWRAAGIDTVIAIERCGASPDGRARNMRGEVLGAEATALDPVFLAGPWRRIAIGDGGNEIGMGSLPPGLVADSVTFGDVIRCVIPADHLIAAGVSHWGAYALIGALSSIAPGVLACLDARADQDILRALVEQGPAIDGVTLRAEMTIDGLTLAEHAAVRDRIVAIARGDAL